jgi:hypothetical protein
MFRRGNYFWSHDGETGKQETLRTKDKATALRLLHSKNEAYFTVYHANAELVMQIDDARLRRKIIQTYMLASPSGIQTRC